MYSLLENLLMVPEMLIGQVGLQHFQAVSLCMPSSVKRQKHNMYLCIIITYYTFMYIDCPFFIMGVLFELW